MRDVGVAAAAETVTYTCPSGIHRRAEKADETQCR